MGEEVIDTLGLEEAAAFLRVAPSTLRKRAAAGRMLGTKRGGRWSFRAVDLEAYFDQFRNDAPRSEAAGKEIGALKHVYVIRCGGFVKIGVAADVQERWRALSTANPAIEPVLYQTAAINDAWDVEKQAHAALAAYRVRGEWFRCEDHIAIDVVRALEQGEDLGR